LRISIAIPTLFSRNITSMAKATRPALHATALKLKHAVCEVCKNAGTCGL
jgi:hypothetical protein